MRERLAQLAAVLALILTVAMSQPALAQQETERSAGDQKTTAGASETIRGVIAAVTAEGEVFFNHQTNSAVRTEAAFLTVVGSPMHSAAADSEHKANASENEKHGQMNRKRHNIYIVWLTPKTKICQAGDRSAKADDNNRKEANLDQLEVGDHVEVQFAHHEDSAAHNDVHQSQQMRAKHGRHRTHVGYATAITIMSSNDHDRSSSERGAKSGEGPK